jgi:hypothetical protein
LTDGCAFTEMPLASYERCYVVVFWE